MVTVVPGPPDKFAAASFVMMRVSPAILKLPPGFFPPLVQHAQPNAPLSHVVRQSDEVVPWASVY
jgi:hypothetical protein